MIYPRVLPTFTQLYAGTAPPSPPAAGTRGQQGLRGPGCSSALPPAFFPPAEAETPVSGEAGRAQHRLLGSEGSRSAEPAPRRPLRCGGARLGRAPPSPPRPAGRPQRSGESLLPFPTPGPATSPREAAGPLRLPTAGGRGVGYGAPCTGKGGGGKRRRGGRGEGRRGRGLGGVCLPWRFCTRMSLMCPMSSSRWNQSHSCPAMVPPGRPAPGRGRRERAAPPPAPAPSAGAERSGAGGRGGGAAPLGAAPRPAALLPPSRRPPPSSPGAAPWGTAGPSWPRPAGRTKRGFFATSAAPGDARRVVPRTLVLHPRQNGQKELGTAEGCDRRGEISAAVN